MTEAPPTRILLVRHGEITANIDKVWHGSTDSSLTMEGYQQAQRLAAHLAESGARIAAVYSSPLERARHTADAIAAALGLETRLAPGLAEYGIGDWEGTSYMDLMGSYDFFGRSHADLEWAPPGGESLKAVAERVVAAWHAIAAAHPGDGVIAVSHGAAIAAGLAALLHDDPRNWQRYHVRNTSVTELTVSPPSLVAFDQVPHLE